MTQSAATTLVRRLPRTTLVVGKGGVGKTTAAAALALEASRTITQGRTLVLTSDPARALPAVLDQDVGADAAPVRFAPRLQARVLDAAALRARFMKRWSRTISLILDRGTYLDDEDIGPLVETALPGSDEIFAALELAALLAGTGAPDAPARIVVDTAPTGHTLRLLRLPQTFRALVRLLDTMQGKHRLMVRALTRGYRADDADDFIDEMTRLVTALEEALVDPQRCTALIVTNPAELVQEETRRYLGALRELRIDVAAVIWNASDAITEPLGGVPQYIVPRLERIPAGGEGLQAWLGQLRLAEPTGRARVAAERGRKVRAAGRPTKRSSSPLDRLLRPLTIVAGKGGVGKTTVAAALALHSSRSARSLVVSTDPAPSLADALEQPVPDADTAVGKESTTCLFARQMDASAAFSRLRDEYRSRVDALFDGLVGRGVDLSQDRAIVRDLMALAPPGIDEVYALSLLSDALFEQRYERVIVDPAPTGHLLRLLEMPKVALSWSHQLMRLMLKYKEVGGLGETAADVLAFARNLRALDALLHERPDGRAGVVIVTLDESVVAGETRRLADEVAARGISIAGVVVNRARGRVATFPLPEAPVHLEAPLWTPPPIGTAQLIEWSQTWAPLTS